MILYACTYLWVNVFFSEVNTVDDTGGQKWCKGVKHLKVEEPTQGVLSDVKYWNQLPWTNKRTDEINTCHDTHNKIHF